MIKNMSATKSSASSSGFTPTTKHQYGLRKEINKKVNSFSLTYKKISSQQRLHSV